MYLKNKNFLRIIHISLCKCKYISVTLLHEFIQNAKGTIHK